MTDLGSGPDAVFTPADRTLLALFDTAVDRLLAPPPAPTTAAAACWWSPARSGAGGPSRWGTAPCVPVGVGRSP